MPKTWTIPSTLCKSAGAEYRVGGVASGFYRDLDGDAIAPDAVRRAIPGFMAQRGIDGIRGGPLRLHHDFWNRFLKEAIARLNLPTEKQMELVSAIALPLGRVTKMWVDESGDTHWEGILSAVNPISRIIWGMLQEGLIHLGVSLGGRINETQPGRDGAGQVANLITNIRLDELSVTDNPAYRLTEGDRTGAYIAALTKSIRAITMTSTLRPKRLSKMGNPGSEFGSGEWGGVKTNLSRDDINPTQNVPRKTGGHQRENVDSKLGGKVDHKAPPKSTGNEPKTDVWGLTVSELTQELKKCAAMKKAEQWSAPDTLQKFTDGAIALSTITETPPDALVNLVRMLHYCCRFCQELPYMDAFTQGSTLEAMSGDLQKSLNEFSEKMPQDLKGKVFRPEGSPNVAAMAIAFPQQYATY